MRIAVVGGTGSIGAPLAAALAARGDEVRVLSRNAPERLPAGSVTHHRVDLASGEGLAEAFAGVEAVVDAVNDSRPRRAKDVLVEGSRRLLAAEAEAGVGHHVAISIVGCDSVPIGYYRAKVAQEEVVAGGSVPWSLLRASQFHTLLAFGFGAAARLRISPAGAAKLQPVAPEVVAERLVEIVHAGPAGRVPDIAGPQIETLSELARSWRRHSSRRLLPLRMPMIGPVGRPLRRGALCDETAAAGGPTFAEWLATEPGTSP